MCLLLIFSHISPKFSSPARPFHGPTPYVSIKSQRCSCTLCCFDLSPSYKLDVAQAGFLCLWGMVGKGEGREAAARLGASACVSHAVSRANRPTVASRGLALGNPRRPSAPLAARVGCCSAWSCVVTGGDDCGCGASMICEDDNSDCVCSCVSTCERREQAKALRGLEVLESRNASLAAQRARNACARAPVGALECGPL